MISVLSAAMVAVGVTSSCLAWSLASQPVEGILVLRNGNILHGKVQQEGDFYNVHLPNGKLQVRQQQVEMFCENLQQAYQRRREARTGSTADSHLEMAAWCLRHDLLEQADSELKDAATIEPNHRRLSLLQRQLKLSRQLADRKQQPSAPPAPVETPLDPEALEKAPQWARALFIRQIQPLMVHSCIVGGCHQAGSTSSFQLNRLALDGAGHPETTLRNLAATLEQINWDSAADSQLLRRAQKAHGALTASTPLPAHKLQVLQGWVEQLTEAHHKDSQLQLLPPVVEVAQHTTRPTLQLRPPQPTSTPAPKEIQQAGFSSDDPFDPNAFNEQEPSADESQTEQSDSNVPHVLTPDE